MEQYHNTVSDLLDDDFDLFHKGLLNEIAESGEDIDPDIEEVKVLYELMKKEKEVAAEALKNKDPSQIEMVAKGYQMMMNDDDSDPMINSNDDQALERKGGATSLASELLEMSDEYNGTEYQDTSTSLDFNDLETAEPKLQSEMRQANLPKSHRNETFTRTMQPQNDLSLHNLGSESMLAMQDDLDGMVHQSTRFDEIQQEQDDSDWSMSNYKDDDEPLDELDIFLQGMPKSRVKSVRDVFSRSLGDPSLLRLIPILRENMPSNITKKWLRETNIKNAEHVLAQLEEEGLVDIHTLNGMIQVQANVADSHGALEFHDKMKKTYGFVSAFIHRSFCKVTFVL